jgi:2-dehydropantoate 2-reductase
MKIAVVGAGGMGGSFGALLAKAGNDVKLIDTWAEHVDTINRDGIRVGGAVGDLQVRVAAMAEPDEAGWADWVIAFIDSNATRDAAKTIEYVLSADGSVVTMQNGIGNVEALQELLGAHRVVGGSSMCSAAVAGPGHVLLTHSDYSSIGEVDGTASERVKTLAAALEGAGLKARIDDQIMVKVWSKFLLNCGINALCAVTGMRTGEMSRVPEIYALQDHIIREALAVTEAKGIKLADPDIAGTIKKAAFYRFNKPSMLQHVTAGRRTEIDAINGALIREAKVFGIPTPYNEALVALLKGVELARMRAVHEPDLDYDAWEKRIADEPLPDAT